MTPIPTGRLAHIKDQLERLFANYELDDLAYRLNIDPEIFPSQKSARAWQMLEYVNKRGLLDQFLENCKTQRPNADWALDSNPLDAQKVNAATETLKGVAQSVHTIDKIYSGIAVMQDNPNEASGNHRLQFEGTPDGITAQTRDMPEDLKHITGPDLVNLPADELKLINTYVRSMELGAQKWDEIYPKRILAKTQRAREKIDQQLSQIVSDMQIDLLGILDFLNRIGLYLDDHYIMFRSIIAGWPKSSPSTPPPSPPLPDSNRSPADT